MQAQIKDVLDTEFLHEFLVEFNRFKRCVDRDYVGFLNKKVTDNVMRVYTKSAPEYLVMGDVVDFLKEKFPDNEEQIKPMEHIWERAIQSTVTT